MALHLDARQRAMLAEMGVRVFLPESDAAPATPAAIPGARPTTAPTAAPKAAPAPGPTAAQVSASASPRVRGPADALSWPDLQAAVAACRACSLCDSRRHTVFGVGGPATDGVAAPTVDWLVVGEAPGENEDAQGEPFVGQAGKLLDLMLKTMGLTRKPVPDSKLRPRVYIVNVLKCRPPMNRNPEPGEIAQCEPYLKRQIALLQPRIILAMGRFAIQTLLAPSVPGVHTAAVGTLRGKVHHYEGVPVVATYHPSYLLRSPHEKAKAWADLCLAMDVFDGLVDGPRP